MDTLEKEEPKIYKSRSYKLTEDDVKYIRERKPKTLSEKMRLALMYNVDITTIYNVLSGRRWKEKK